jgi:hypothetical protein
MEPLSKVSAWLEEVSVVELVVVSVVELVVESVVELVVESVVELVVVLLFVCRLL